MSEQEWLACHDTRSLLNGIGHVGSERKHWLLACAFCRTIWLLLVEVDRAVVETVEKYAEGRLTDEEVMAFVEGHNPPPRAPWASAAISQQAADAMSHLVTWWRHRWLHEDSDRRWNRSTRTRLGYAHDAAVRVARSAAEAHAKKVPWWEARKPQAALVHDLFDGVLWPIKPDPSWLSWNDSVVVKIARTSYDERRFSDLPLLGDALEDAGCTNPDIIGHCRGGGEHVRGCWVVDLLLGRR